MTHINDHLSATDVVALARRGNFYQRLQSALRRRHRPEPPVRLYADLGLPPSQWPDFTPRWR